MNFILAMMCGFIVSLMSIFNGQLSGYVGTFLATIIIHLTGLITVILFVIATHQTIKFNKETPLYAYLGGVVGVLTTLFQVFSITKIGAAQMTALSLLGQIVTSIILEHYGLLGAKQQKITLPKILSLGIISCGIGVMLL